MQGQLSGRERLPPEHLGQPQHAEPRLFHATHVVLGLRRREVVEVAGGHGILWLSFPERGHQAARTSSTIVFAAEANSDPSLLTST
jgi:hypothetical protein